MRLSYRLTVGAGGLLLLMLAVALLTRDNSQGIAPSPESIPNLSVSPSAEGAVEAGYSLSFIPGGRKLPVVDADSPIARQSVLTLASHSGSLPPANDLQVRSRIATLAADLDLRPPASGEDADAARDLVFDLFDDVQLVGRVERMEYHHAERVVYSGPLTNVPGGDFIIAYNNGQVAATFTTPGKGFFQLRPSGTDAVAVYQLDLSRLPPCEASTPPASPSSGASVTTPTSVAEIRARAAIHRQFAASSPSVEGGVYGGQGQQGGDGSHLTFTQIDVLVVNTANALAAAGGESAMAAIMDMTFARANSAFINSDIGLRLRMVRSETVAYDETAVTMNTLLSDLADGSGAFSSVPSWRDASGADLVALFFDGSGGLAYIYNGSPNSGFSVNGINALESTFIHEIGHNLGCLHDRDNNAMTPNFPYSFGWRFTPDNSPELRTIMAYAPGNQIPYFSNPEVTYMGTPTGVPIGEPLESNNAEMIRQTKTAVAAFRSESGNQPPTVSLTSPLREAPLKALDSIMLSAEAADPDGAVTEVVFYRLMSDSDFGFTNRSSTLVDADSSAPYTGLESTVPAGFWTYAAVAVDNEGAIGIDTVSVAVAPHYRRTNYPLPHGKIRVNLEGINEAGRLVGFGHNGNTNAIDTQAAYWEDGQVFPLDPLPGDTGAKALAVGQDGRIFGESIGVGGSRAVIWEHSSSPTDISDVIDDFTAESAIGVDEWGRIYLSSGNDFRRFNDPGSTTTGLNQRWHKVANTGSFAAGHDYNFGAQAFHAMRWNDGGTQLPPLAGFTSSWGRATNRSGAVFGFSNPEAGGWNQATNRLTFWPAGSTTPVDLGTLGEEGGMAYDLNDWNHAVGSANVAELDSRAILWKGEGDLITLVDVLLPQEGLKRDARLINNRGQIAGTGFSGSDQFIFFLDPMPGLDNRYWLANHFSPAELEDPTLTDDTANPSGDGLPNLLKRAFGLDPRAPVSASERQRLPHGSIGEDGHFHFSYLRQRAPREISYQPQTSFTLTSDSWNNHLLEQVEVIAVDNDFEEVRLRTTFPLSEEDKVFMRVELNR
jgi:uncharacterized membrane protein